MPSVLESTDSPIGLVDRDSIRSTTAATLSDRGTLSGRECWDVYEPEGAEQPEISIEASEAPSLPSWVGGTIKDIVSKLLLDPNWDSYGASEISPQAVEHAIKLLLNIVSEDTTAPWVVPTSSGGIQLEWHTDEADLEVEVSGVNRGMIYWRSRRDDQEWEGDLVTNTNRLRDLLARVE
jgi:hypothetical protein